MSEGDWVTPLQRGLLSWGAGRLDPAVEALDLCLATLRSVPQTELWQVCVLTSLSHIQLESGYFDMSQEAQHQAREIWSQQLFESRWKDITPNLQWFEGLLHSNNCPDEADLYRYSLEQHSSVFLGNGRAGAFGPTVSKQAASGAEESDFQMPTLYVQKVDQRVHPRRWTGHLRDALTAAQMGRRNDMANELLEARSIGVHVRAEDHGLRLFWSAWLECLCCFLVAEYAQSDRARQDFDELWLGLSVQGDISKHPDTREVVKILEDAEYGVIVTRMLEDLGRGDAPGLDPWRDLKTGMAPLGENTENAEQQWREIMTDGFEGIREGKFGDIENRAARMKARLETLEKGGEAHYRLALILLDHLLSVVAHKQGKYSFADTLFAHCDKSWSAILPHFKGQGPWMGAYRKAATDTGNSYLLEGFPGRLFDPGEKKHGMVTMEVFAPITARSEDGWEPTLAKAWAQAREGRYDIALRSAAKLEQMLRRDSVRSLPLAFVLNAQAAIYWLMGSYQDSVSSSRESQQIWRLEFGGPDHEAHVDAYLETFRFEWPDLMSALVSKRQSGKPVLIEPETDIEHAPMKRWQEPAAAPSERKAVEKPQGWFSKLLGRKSRAEES